MSVCQVGVYGWIIDKILGALKLGNPIDNRLNKKIGQTVMNTRFGSIER